MSDPIPTYPQFRKGSLSGTRPFHFELELDYKSLYELQQELSADITIESLPQLSLTFEQEVGHVQGAAGVQLFNWTLPQLGPRISQLSFETAAQYATDNNLEFSAELGATVFDRVRIVGQGSVTFTPSGDSGPVESWMGGIKLEIQLDAPAGALKRR
jgi:hypothetical protein